VTNHSAGSTTQWADSTNVLSDARWAPRLVRLYG
jgi:hypothetical protein